MNAQLDLQNTTSLIYKNESKKKISDKKIKEIQERFLAYHPQRTEFSNLKTEYDQLKEKISDMTSELNKLRERAVEIEQEAFKVDIDLNIGNYEEATGKSTLIKNELPSKDGVKQPPKLEAHPIADKPEPIPEGLSPNLESLNLAKQIEKDISLMKWYIQYRSAQSSPPEDDIENLKIGEELTSKLETEALKLIDQHSHEFTSDDLDTLNKMRDKALKTIGINPEEIGEVRKFKEIQEQEASTREELLDQLGYELWLPKEIESNGDNESQKVKDLAFEIQNIYQQILKGNLNLIQEYKSKIEDLRALKYLSKAHRIFIGELEKDNNWTQKDAMNTLVEFESIINSCKDSNLKSSLSAAMMYCAIGVKPVTSYLIGEGKEDRKDIITDLFNNSENFRFVHAGDSFFYLINLKAATSIMKRNNELFPVEAIKTPEPWVVQFMEEAGSQIDKPKTNNDSLKLARKLILFGVPYSSTINTVLYKKVRSKINNNIGEFEEYEIQYVNELINKEEENLKLSKFEKNKLLDILKNRIHLTEDEIWLITNSHKNNKDRDYFVFHKNEDKEFDKTVRAFVKTTKDLYRSKLKGNKEVGNLALAN